MGLVLVTGADGFIGQRLMGALARSGFEVRGAVRGSVAGNGISRLQGQSLVAIGNLDAQPRWDSALSSVDCVVHLAARAHVMREHAADPLSAFRSVNTEPTRQLVAAARARSVKQFIYISSAGTLGTESGVQAFDDSTPSNPVGPYAISKLEAEESAQRVCGTMPLLILRPPLVYGPENKGNFLRLLRLLSSGIPLPLAGVTARRSLIFIDNLTAAIVNAVSRGPSEGRYLVSDGADLSMADVCRILVGQLPRPSSLFRCPPQVLELTLRLAGQGHLVQKLLRPCLVDGSRFCRDFSWTAPVDVERGLVSTALWYSKTSH